jgi:hypothetical protein
MTRKTKTPIVEADTDAEARERQMAQNEAWLNDPRNQRDLEEGRLALEAELAASAAKAQAEEDPMDAWARKLAAEQMARRPELANLETAEERERREELQRRLDEEEPVMFVQRSPGVPLKARQRRPSSRASKPQSGLPPRSSRYRPRTPTIRSTLARSSTSPSSCSAVRMVTIWFWSSRTEPRITCGLARTTTGGALRPRAGA